MRLFFTSLPQADLDLVVRALETYAEVGGDDLSSLRSLTWEEVGTMRRAGLTIGSHTRRHVILTAESDAVVADELTASRRRIESALGAPVRHFAYPDGQFNPGIVRAVAAAGYELGVTTCRHRDPEYPRLTVPRRVLWEHSTVDAALRFSPAILRCYASGAFDLGRHCERPHGDARPALHELVAVAQ